MLPVMLLFDQLLSRDPSEIAKHVNTATPERRALLAQHMGKVIACVDFPQFEAPHEIVGCVFPEFVASLQPVTEEALAELAERLKRPTDGEEAEDPNRSPVL